MERKMEEVLNILAAVGVRMGERLMSDALNGRQAIDRTALANAILRSSVEQASKIVRHLGIRKYLSDERGDFGAMVGIIAGGLFDLASLFIDPKVTMADCSLDAGDVVVRALIALRS